MRIIAGSLKGRRLRGFKGSAIRPTLDRARETLFNIIGPSMADSSFLDLFAGTGANGLEAFSRGAKDLVFVDSSPSSVKVIQSNLGICGINITGQVKGPSRFSIIQKDASLAIRELGRKKRGFDFVFLDPPYKEEAYLFILNLIRECSILNPGGWIIAEHYFKYILKFPDASIIPFKRVKIGNSSFSLFDKESFK